MKKIFLILLFILIFSTPAFSETIKTGIEYSIENAQKIPVANIPKKISKKVIKSNLIDPFFDENKALVEKKTLETNDRIIEPMGDGYYCIIYKNDLYTDYYYNSIGKLYAIAIRKNTKDNPPYWFYYYNNKGEILRIAFYPKKNEIYTFDSKGNKAEYLLNDKLYTKDGILIK